MRKSAAGAFVRFSEVVDWTDLEDERRGFSGWTGETVLGDYSQHQDRP